MATHLKERTGEAETREYDATVRHTVEDILADIEARGDAAVRANCR
jgi:sulfopropanediol 3-dehydrogenase